MIWSKKNKNKCFEFQCPTKNVFLCLNHVLGVVLEKDQVIIRYDNSHLILPGNDEQHAKEIYNSITQILIK
jgi:hypothetical protein